MLPPHRKNLLVPRLLGVFYDGLARPIGVPSITGLLAPSLNGSAPVVDTRFDAMLLGIFQYLFALGR
jgi:hypothetical protein